MQPAKLIVLNGFAAAGKTTIAQKYIAEHSMAFVIEADDLVDNMGDWHNHKEEVRKLTFELTKAMMQAYLPSGHDVVLPYSVTKSSEVQEFEAIARACKADYFEFVLHNERSDAIARLLARGKWGQATSPALTTANLPEIEQLMGRMEVARAERPGAAVIPLAGKTPDETYAELMRQVSAITQRP